MSLALPFFARRSTRTETPVRVVPRHVGVVMDGNRRWAKAAGLAPSVGHDAGARHVRQLLRWCSAWDISHVSVYVLSADNIRKRPAGEVEHLFGLLADTLPDLVGDSDEWALHVSGDTRLLPHASRDAIERVVRETRSRPRHVTMAVGYDGHHDIASAVRAAVLRGGPVDVDSITASLGGGPVKDIDLVIRTSGESRLSGFFPWQTAHAELYLSQKMWPAFSASDFEQALRYYESKHGGQ